MGPRENLNESSCPLMGAFLYLRSSSAKLRLDMQYKRTCSSTRPVHQPNWKPHTRPFHTLLEDDSLKTTIDKMKHFGIIVALGAGLAIAGPVLATRERPILEQRAEDWEPCKHCVTMGDPGPRDGKFRRSLLVGGGDVKGTAPRVGGPH